MRFLKYLSRPYLGDCGLVLVLSAFFFFFFFFCCFFFFFFRSCVSIATT